MARGHGVAEASTGGGRKLAQRARSWPRTLWSDRSSLSQAGCSTSTTSSSSPSS
jgi:hypothetical protein